MLELTLSVRRHRVDLVDSAVTVMGRRGAGLADHHAYQHSPEASKEVPKSLADVNKLDKEMNTCVRLSYKGRGPKASNEVCASRCRLHSRPSLLALTFCVTSVPDRLFETAMSTGGRLPRSTGIVMMKNVTHVYQAMSCCWYNYCYY